MRGDPEEITRLVEYNAGAHHAVLDREPREHAVPCQHIGCRATTFHWSAYCQRHRPRPPVTNQRDGAA